MMPSLPFIRPFFVIRVPSLYPVSASNKRPTTGERRRDAQHAPFPRAHIQPSALDVDDLHPRHETQVHGAGAYAAVVLREAPFPVHEPAALRAFIGMACGVVGGVKQDNRHTQVKDERKHPRKTRKDVYTRGEGGGDGAEDGRVLGLRCVS